MATAPKPATSPWGRATDGLRANAADPACSLAVEMIGFGAIVIAWHPATPRCGLAQP